MNVIKKNSGVLASMVHLENEETSYRAHHVIADQIDSLRRCFHGNDVYVYTQSPNTETLLPLPPWICVC